MKLNYLFDSTMMILVSFILILRNYTMELPRGYVPDDIITLQLVMCFCTLKIPPCILQIPIYW